MDKESEISQGLGVSEFLYRELLKALAEEGIETAEQEQEYLEEAFLGIMGNTEN